MAQRPADFLPLTHLAFQILLSIGRADRHGYAIIKDIEERTAGAVRLRSGTLYTAIQRLVDASLVEPAEAPEGADSRRRYYRLTALGIEVAALESSRLEQLLDTAKERDLTAAAATASR